MTNNIVRPPDEIFRGKHCWVEAWILDDECLVFVPHYCQVGSVSPEASDREQIAHFISRLPSATLFPQFKSFAQVLEWMSFNDSSVDIAKCFLSGRGQPDDPPLRDLKDGLIDQFSYDYVWAETDIYENLWRLIQRRGDEIKAVCQKNWGYPFKSHRELLQEIIRKDLEGEFVMCLRRRYIYNASHTEQLAKFKRKKPLSKQEEKKMYTLINQHTSPIPWLNRLLLASEALAKRGDIVCKKHMDVHGVNIDALSRLQIKRECIPDLRHHREPTHTWEEGIKIEGVLGWKKT